MMPGKYIVIAPQGETYWGHKKGDIITLVESFNGLNGGYFTPLVGKNAIDENRKYLQCHANEVERIPDELQGESDEVLRLYYSL